MAYRDNGIEDLSEVVAGLNEWAPKLLLSPCERMEGISVSITVLPKIGEGSRANIKFNRRTDSQALLLSVEDTAVQSTYETTLRVGWEKLKSIARSTGTPVV